MPHTIAPKSLRLVHFGIDLLIVLFLKALFSPVLLSWHPSFDLSWLYSFFYFAYYLLLEGFLGKTIGKFVTGTELVFLIKKQKWFWLLVRTLLRLNPFDVVSYLFGGNTGTHDLLSFTVVVRKME